MSTIDAEVKAKVNAWMAAFRYGGRVDDLGKVDDRHSSGRYDKVTWHIALDGATLFGHANEFKACLVHALNEGKSDKEAERYAYETVAEKNGF